MSEHVVWFDSSETGAPALNNAAGSLIGVLKGCLVTGFNVKTLTSVVVSGGVATATCAGHGYSGIYGKDLLISGATPAGLNGRKALTFVDTNTFKFAAPGVADGAATGTITAKRDPLGWVELFSDPAGKSIFKRTDVTATSMLLHITDTNTAPATATDARARMIESATDINTLTGLAPTDTQLSGGQYWNKGANSATAKQWVLVGDSKRFFIFTRTNMSYALQMFGDFTSLKSGDAYNTMLVGSTAAWSGAASGNGLLVRPGGFQAGNASQVIARGYSQAGGAVFFVSVGIASSVGGGSGDAAPAYPSPVDSGLLVFPGLLAAENDSVYGFPVRGIIPACVQVLAKTPFSELQIVEPVVSMPGRKLLSFYITSSNSTYQMLMDITGPWA